MTGTLYLVATPIGNLGDMTFRAVETLKAVRVIAAEDTRRERILCDHFGVETQLVSFPAFREAERAEEVIGRLKGGDDVALVTDAGSPGISDPGGVLVGRAIEEGVKVVPIPGPSAVVAALSASGLPADWFHFVGFLPRKGAARGEILSWLSRLPGTIALYESPLRLRATLLELAAVLGDRRAVVARELTKIHEELARGRLSELAERFAGEVRGEVTLLVAGVSREAGERASDDAIRAELERRLATGETSLKDLARELAEATGRPRREIYALALAVAAKKEG
jgi:16S rRNA (cytidine1402-2'-O)-methyltransferase